MSVTGVVQESAIDVSLIGTGVFVPGNMISKSIYRYNCIRKTSMGSKILGAAISPFTLRWIQAREKFDYCMHYLALPLIFVAISVRSETFWYILLIFFAIHLVNVVAAFMFFAMPIQNAKAIALMFPTKDSEPIGALMNNFVKISASQKTMYVATDEQSAIFMAAQVSGESMCCVFEVI